MAKLSLHLDKMINRKALDKRLAKIAGAGDPKDSKTRMEVLGALKEASAKGRAKAEKMLLVDGSGHACATRLSFLQDEIIAAIHTYVSNFIFDESDNQKMAVLAVGGYGRGTLAPGSDLDLLFLMPSAAKKKTEALVEAILYMLWDMGYKVGHATRTVGQCVSLSLEDMTIRTSILEARFLFGDQALYDELIGKFERDVIAKTAQEFIAAKLEERDTRHSKSGRSRYLVEPNVKDGKGGLRDLHTLFWISKFYYRVRTRRELADKKVFSKKDLKQFTKAEDFLWAVRCHMHFLTGRAEERLSFDLQPALAERLGYLPRPGQSAVERFMKHYFLVAKDVGDLTRILCSALEEEQAKSGSRVPGFIRSFTRRPKKIKGSEDFESSNNRIMPVDDEVFKRDPVNILRMFQLAEEKELLFHPNAMQLVSRSLKLINKSLRSDPAANAAFLATLTSRKSPERTLRKMNEAGVLGKFIPDFGKVVAMMQFNMYHHYTVDEHLLRSIGVLSEIEHGGMGEQHPLANEIMKDTPNRVALYVALLLHDIAKGRPEDHSIAGAKVARKLCPRLGLDEKQTKLVVWLIEHHLLMSNTSQSRDLHDFKTIQDFAAVMQNFERMKALLVLTVCDIKAVGPGVWNGWKGQLLRTIYYETEPLLTGGFTQTPRHQRVHEVLEELRAELSDWDVSERDRVLDLHYDNYWLSVPREDQIRQLAFIRDCDQAGLSFATTVSSRQFEAITEITLIAPDHPRLLSTVTGCCAAAGANIVDAQIFTTKDGRALNSIYITRLYDEPDDEQRRAETIGETIEKVLTGEKRLGKLLADRDKPKKRQQAFTVEPIVMINNELSNKFTVIEVEGLDRPGLLSDITDALADLSLDIKSAHIATFGEKVIDTFYATDLTGTKISSPQKLAAVKRKLMTALGGSAQEGPKKPSRKKTAA